MCLPTSVDATAPSVERNVASGHHEQQRLDLSLPRGRNFPILTNRVFVKRGRAMGNEAEYRVIANRDHYGMIRHLSEPGDTVFALVRAVVAGDGGQ